MDRKFLEEKGLEKEIIDEIMKEHGKAVQAAKPTEDYETLKSEKETLAQKINDLNTELQTTNEKLTNYDNTLAEKDKQLKSFEIKDLKTRIASEAGLPINLANRLSGETEEEIKADAESLSGFIVQKQTLPMGSTEPQNVEEKMYSNQSRIIEEQYKSE